jgi:hypothetical protein
MMQQTQSLYVATKLPGGLSEQGASISRLRRFSFWYRSTPASRPAMTIPPTALVLRH